MHRSCSELSFLKFVYLPQGVLKRNGASEHVVLKRVKTRVEVCAAPQ